MDNNNEVDYQNVNKEAAAARVVTDCLRNHVVLWKIFENFSSIELRQLSFVNKRWKCEAQSLMRKRGQYTAYVKAHYDRFHQDEQADAFISDLKQMNPVPFSGISIDIDVDFGLGPLPIAALDPLQGVIIDQPSLKSVSVRLHGFWSDNIGCPGVLLTKKVLQDCSDVLEELELEIGFGYECFMEQVVQDCIFPSLKILKLMIGGRGGLFRPQEVGYENYLKAMVSRAPKLKILRSNYSLSLLLRVVEGSSVVPVYGCLVCAPFDAISENVISVIRLDSLQLKYTGLGFNLERFNRIAPVLLQTSCTTTLRSMTMDPVLAVSLMCFGISLENVKSLQIDVKYELLERLEPRVLRIVKNFDFTRIFPNLNKVTIDPDLKVHGLSPHHMNAIIERANAVLKEPKPDRAARVKEMVFSWNTCSTLTQFYVQMFPNIEKLDITTYERADGQNPFGLIWNWLELKDLKVQRYTLPIAANLDSVFCGIFPEEVAELRLGDDDYLKTVNIVPVMPAVTCLKNLRTLSLQHEHHQFYGPFGDDASFLFSKVTALLAFARLPALAVSLKIRADIVPPAMTHLEPYVTVTSELLDD